MKILRLVASLTTLLTLSIIPLLGQNLPNEVTKEFQEQLTAVNKSYPVATSYYTHPNYPNYQFRKNHDYHGSQTGCYTIWDNDKLVKIIPEEQFFEMHFFQSDFSYIKNLGKSLSSLYYASLIENNVLNIRSEKDLFIKEVKVRLGIIPAPKKHIEMSGGYSPMLMDIVIDQCQKGLKDLERKYKAKKISKSEYIKKKQDLKETLEEAKMPHLTMEEERRVDRFISQLQTDYPIKGYEAIRIDNLSFAYFVKSKQDPDKITAMFKISFEKDQNYDIAYKATLLPQTDWKKYMS